MCSHIPDRGEQMVRYYGYYSNVSRGKRKETEDDGIPCILEADKSSKEYRKNWARLIQKIYEVDPLTCPKCGRGRSCRACLVNSIMNLTGQFRTQEEPPAELEKAASP